MPATKKDTPFLSNNTALLRRLEQCTDLPTPPGIATRLIALGRDPSADIGRIADTVSLDPALTTKIFRIANSALYARQRKVENLRQAIMLFGLNGVISLALSFSLTSSFRAGDKKGLDYNLFWRRSLTVAACSRVIGIRLGLTTKEDLFLAGLLNDVGMLALDKAAPEVYQKLSANQSDHVLVQTVENDTFGADHAAVGAWLLETWKLPERFVHAVAGSHNSTVSSNNGGKPNSLAPYVAVAAKVTDIWWHEGQAQATDKAAETAARLLDIDRETLAECIDIASAELTETAELFEIDLGDISLMESIRDQAKEVIMLRNLQNVQHSDDLYRKTELLESRTRELEEETRRDGLTGLYNRVHLDHIIAEEFANAKRLGWPLALVFLDLDHFKQVNDSHGHQAGDEVLRGTARLLEASTRDTDFAARYGGEEFVIVLPGTGIEGACITCERLLKAFRTKKHDIRQEKPLTVTVSIGVAVLDKGHIFASAEELVQAADHMLYSAKRQGRDRWLCHDPKNTVGSH